MLKTFWLSLFITLSFSAFGQEKGKCRYDLVGPRTMPDAILEREPVTREECHKRAIKLLKLNSDSYDKVLIRHGEEKNPTVIELKDVKGE